ncbi:MAG: ATP-dependent ligase [Symbiobacteriaceae bacterium]|jgi:bifunctional non-homologous end joining protein LigD|nr:ATP-dependent ligase [Symbiobacteriaceae bacterium]
MDLPFEPMLLSPAPAPFADPAWLYQVKWDGVRNLTLIDGGRIRHWSRRLRDRTALFPDLDGLVTHLPKSQKLVLDGEIVVLRDGKPSFPAILERDVGGQFDPRKLRTAPATLILFDILEYGDRPLYTTPLEERLDLLARLLPEPGPSFQTAESFPGPSGPDLFAATTQQQLEGVVAKRRASTYTPGLRTRDWLKIKRKQQLLAVILGYTAPVGRPGGLLLGAHDPAGRLTYIGRVGSGITAEQLRTLKAHLPPAPRPLAYEPTLRDRFSGPPGPVVWTEPRLTAIIEYTEWTEEQRLRDPVLIGFSTEPPQRAQLP